MHLGGKFSSCVPREVAERLCCTLDKYTGNNCLGAVFVLSETSLRMQIPTISQSQVATTSLTCRRDIWRCNERELLPTTPSPPRIPSVPLEIYGFAPWYYLHYQQPVTLDIREFVRRNFHVSGRTLVKMTSVENSNGNIFAGESPKHARNSPLPLSRRKVEQVLRRRRHCRRVTRV